MNSDDALGRIEESLVLSRGIKSESVRASVVETVEKIRARLEKGEKDATPEEELNFFRERAKALGFNCDDPDDEFGRIINQGLKDYNPERVLRDCEYLFVFPSGARGVPARMVGLPSAAMKWVFCTKKEYAIGGWDLDNIYDSPVGGFGFKTEYCQKCEYKAPRDREWAWTSKWQNQEMEKYKEIIKKIDS